jgi:hypothetical protein
LSLRINLGAAFREFFAERKSVLMLFFKLYGWQI